VIGVRAAGDAAVLLETGPASTDQDGNGAAGLAALIRAAALPGVVDIVPGAVTVLVSIQPGSWVLGQLAARLRTRLTSLTSTSVTTGPTWPTSPG
jgi:allophanate hydrolase subunit 1